MVDLGRIQGPGSQARLFFSLWDLEAWKGCCREGGLPGAILPLLSMGLVLQRWQCPYLWSSDARLDSCPRGTG